MRGLAPWAVGRALRDCLVDREWPWRLRPWIYHRGLVRRGWYSRVRLRNALSRRIKVGFGPIVTGEDDLGVRKWHIDPFVDAINRSAGGYVADIYFAGQDLRRFDIVVIVKHFEAFTPDVVRRLRERPTRLVYDTADIRYVPTPTGPRNIYENPDARELYFKPFLRSMDALILANPLQRPDFADLAIPQPEIARPLMNRRYRTAYAHGGPVRLIWQGYSTNIAPMRQIHPIVQSLREETGLDVILVYDTEAPQRDAGPIKYTKWKIHHWERVLAAADVGVAIKPVDDPYQQRKPSTKVISYMGAGLPVVCTPTEMDRRVITHGETGYFAHEDREWHACLRALVTDPSLRERVGTAARKHVTHAYGADRILADYVRLFDRLLARDDASPLVGKSYE